MTWYLSETRPQYYDGWLIALINIWRHPDGRERRIRLEGRNLRYVREVSR